MLKHYFRIRPVEGCGSGIRKMIADAKDTARLTSVPLQDTHAGKVSALRAALLSLTNGMTREAITLPEGCFFYHGAAYCCISQPLTSAPIPIGFQRISEELYNRKKQYMHIRRARKQTKLVKKREVV